MSTVKRQGGHVVVRLSREDGLLLRSLTGQVLAMLAEPTDDRPADPLEELVGMTGDPVAAPQDPAVRRLLPDAYADDAAAAAEFRRLMDADLRRGKVEALQRILDDLEEPQIRLADDDAEGWLRGLNDIRLVLGVRLDVQEDMDELVSTLVPDDPRLPLLYGYDRLSRLQEAIVEALDG